MNKAALLEREAASRILVTDGAYRTQIQALALGEADYRGGLDLSRDQKGNHELLSLTRPDAIVGVTSAYLKAGADIISTNTFNANRLSQARYGTQDLVEGINIAAASLARGLADRARAQDDRPRFVAGVVGPTNRILSSSSDASDPDHGDIDFAMLKAVYREQVDALLEGGVDFILIETIFDTRSAEAAIMAVEDAGRACDRHVPIMLSMTFTDRSGRNLSGHTVEAFWRIVRYARPVSIGLNCSFGASQPYLLLKELSQVADCLTMAYPNTALPRAPGSFDVSPREIAAQVGTWAEAGLVNVLGGCCGSTPSHIAAIRAAVDGRAPRPLHAFAPLAGNRPVHSIH